MFWSHKHGLFSQQNRVISQRLTLRIALLFATDEMKASYNKCTEQQNHFPNLGGHQISEDLMVKWFRGGSIKYSD